MNNTDQLVNLKNAARLCGISRTLFYRLLDSAQGPEAVKVDGARYFDRGAVEIWNQERKARRRKGDKIGPQRKKD
ncbi:hypothetical protein FRUB_04520 [Fimbriiglobus ruber]|uniref:Uncharacterized protein n=1 Tax=Fimbriiglobus ruber TaxID=1908690 RepID=A0A225DB96_9BACT|nr:hypothetical protein FRUB_07985 [Fimbriiglobus ruber]OWK36924.1 hypothetical protein FRUB_07976 [Fimbriiglobus ruber]OWK42442.1 hypothetical protein FRUB_04520 [Fimbriiglobus ruber]